MNDRDPFELMESAWAKRRSSVDLEEPEREAALISVLDDLASAAALLRSRDQPVAYAQALHLQAHIAWDLERMKLAERLWTEAVAVLRETDDVLQLAHKVRHLGDLQLERDRVQEAADHYTEALALYRLHPVPPELDVANAVRRMAVLEERVGEAVAARDLWRDARDRYAGLGLTEGVAEAEQHLATLGGANRPQ
jgi:tetratricopeptide (TPR) repeat protein